MFAALLDALGLDRVHVLTLSSGAPAGYLLAATRPARVASLVAISGVSLRHDPPETAGPLAQALFTSRIGQALTATMARRAPERLVCGLLHGESHLSEAEVRRQAAHVLDSPDTLAWLRGFLATIYPYGRRRAGTENDTAQLGGTLDLPLGEIRCPVLIVHGTHDADVPFHHGVHARDHIPGVRHHWIDHGSHLGFWLHPDAGHAHAAARACFERAAC